VAREQLIPDGWKPKLNGTVHVEESKDDPAPPHGTWKIVSAAPGTGQWWLMPVDEAARDWRDRFPGQVTTGCISRSGRVLIPKGYRRPKARDLSPAALQRLARDGAA
jgi:hypothetical protein